MKRLAPWQIPAYFSIGLTGVVLNSLEIILIVLKLSKRRSTKAFEIFLLSLSCSDILVGLMTVVLIIYLMAANSSEFAIPRSNIWFQTFLTCMTFSTSTSVLNVLAIGLDRLLAVRYPFKHRTWMSPQRAKIAVTGIWILNAIVVCTTVPILVSSPQVVLSVPYVCLASAAAFAFGLVFMFLYSSILWTVFKTEMKHDGIQTSEQAKLKATKQRNLAITCTLIMVTFLVCTYPVIIQSIIRIGKVHSNLPFGMIFIILNPIIDPVIYFYKSYMETILPKKQPNEVSSS